MGAVTRAELEALVKRQQKSLDRAEAKNATLQQSLDRAATKNKALSQSLKEALEQQTATAEILRIISRSTTDVQPVFNAIAESAARLCESLNGAIFRRDGDRVVLVADCGPNPLGPIGEFTLPLDRGNIPGRSIIDGQMVHVVDLQAASGEFSEGSEVARRAGFRTALSVPLMREGVAIGVIGARRVEARSFSDRQVALLKTFADQAVIAIENVRLFKELQTRNAEVTEALEQQTATSEILKVISSSPTDTQPVFDAIVQSGVHLFGGLNLSMRLIRGDRIVLVATTMSGPDPVIRVDDDRFLAARTIQSREVVHVPDIDAANWVSEVMKQLAAQRISCACHGPLAARGKGDRDDYGQSCNPRAVHTQADRAAQDLRRSGGHRHRKRAPLQGASGAQC